MRIQTALDRFLIQLEADGRSRHTIGQYRRHVRLLERWLRDEGRSAQIGTVDHEDLALFLSSPAARTRPDGKAKKATSTNALRTSLRVFFTYCEEAGYVERSPARLIRRARCGAPPPRGLTDDEQKRLLKALGKAKGEAEERDEILFRLLLAMGLRIGSALALDAEDVDLDRGELNVRQAKWDRPDVFPLGRGIRGHLRRYLAGRRSGPLIPPTPEKCVPS